MDTIELLVGFNEAFNRHDVDAMMAMMTEDCVFENTYPPPDGERIEGQAAVRRFWEDFFNSSTAAQIEIIELFACGERAAQRWVYSWVGADGQAGHIHGVDVFHLRGGKIAAKLSFVKG